MMQEKLLKTMLICSILFTTVSMSIMLYFSATKTIVIAEEAAPEQASGKQQAEAVQINQLEFREEAGVEGIKIPLPAEVKPDDIAIENRYIENTIRVILSGKFGTFYRDNVVVGNIAELRGGSVSEENGATRLQLQMSGVYEHQYVFENGVLHLSFSKPSELYEKIVVLDAAHGGTDIGHVGNGIKEKELVLEITEKVREKLKDTDIRVYCTRTDDTNVSEDTRAAFANELQADMLISVRAGADESSEKVFGLQTFYNGTYFIPNFGNVQLADMLERSVVTATGAKANGLFVAEDEDVLLSQAQIPSAAIEIGYLTNEEETMKLALEEYKERLAEGVVTAINAAFAELEKNL